LLQNLAKENALLLCGFITALGQWSAGYQDVVRLESQVNILQREKAAHHEPGSHEKHDRKRHLRDDQSRTKASMTESGLRSLSGIFQAIMKLSSNRMDRRSQTAEQRCDERNPNRKEKHAQVERNNCFGRDQVRRQSSEHSFDTAVCKQASSQAANRRKD